jgi:hypothetical protein
MSLPGLEVSSHNLRAPWIRARYEVGKSFPTTTTIRACTFGHDC